MQITIQDLHSVSNRIPLKVAATELTHSERGQSGGYHYTAELSKGQTTKLRRELTRYPKMARARIEERYDNDYNVIGGTLFFSI
jgi:hypothetical protein